ncbi:hypothetical protein GCM10022199_11430 [Marihabitans asiaticum]|uniref:NADH-quinone oxidoreductase subunit I n=1 Tax=Marihabitans asiaticum TaxID=415218 RepID=A0A560WHP9_9MICO|nr:NADH-quinone oxidoreductase subunit I [Marihabitans asiaticum]
MSECGCGAGERPASPEASDLLEPVTLPSRSRGVIALVEANCTSCMLCARECPDWCIYIESHTEEVPAPEGSSARPRRRNVLDRFAIDWSLCMYCGICVEVCPFDALLWSPQFQYPAGDLDELTHEMDVLGGWLSEAPAPPPLDPGSEPAAEAAQPAATDRRGPAARGRRGGLTPRRRATRDPSDSPEQA